MPSAKPISQLLGSLFHDIEGRDAHLPGGLALVDILKTIEVDVNDPASLWHSFDGDEDEVCSTPLREEISWRVTPCGADSNDIEVAEERSLSESTTVDWNVDQENTNARRPKRMTRGMELWKKARAKVLANVKLLPGRIRGYPVVPRCQVLPSPFERELERAEMRSRQRLEDHQKTCGADWLRECEAYDSLTAAIKMFRTGQFMKKRRRSRNAKVTADQELALEERALGDIQVNFRAVCTRHYGSTMGVHRFMQTSDVVRHWWLKASQLLQQKESEEVQRVALSGGPSSASRRDETFWMFSPRFFEIASRSVLTTYDSIDAYVCMERLGLGKQVTYWMQPATQEMDQTSQMARNGDVESSGSDSAASAVSQSDSIATEKLFKRPSELSYLQTIKANHARERKAAETGKRKDYWKRMKAVLTEEEEHFVDKNEEKDTLVKRFQRQKLKNRSIARQSLASRERGSNTLPFRSSRYTSGNRPLGADDLDTKASMSSRSLAASIIREPNMSMFHQRMEAIRNFYFLPASVVRLRGLMNSKDLEELLPTEELLKGIILQLPHEQLEEETLQLRVDDADLRLAHNESVKRVLQMTLKEFPALVQTILRRNDVVLSDGRHENASRTVDILDRVPEACGLSEVNEVLYHTMHPPKGFRSGGERFLMTCLLPELVPRGLKHKAFPTQFVLGNYLVFDNADENDLHKRRLVLLMPPEPEEATDVLDLAKRSIQRYKPHVAEFFNRTIRSVRPIKDWINERSDEVLGIALVQLGHDLLRFRNTPGHCVRFKMLCVIKSSIKNSHLLNQLALTAKLPNGWLDQVLRSFSSTYASVRLEVALVIAGLATNKKLVRRLTRVTTVSTLLYDVVVALIRAADLFSESFCDFFMALTYLFHYSPHRSLVDASLDRWPTLQSAEMISAWPLLLVYAFKYWEPNIVVDMGVGSRRMAALLNEILHHPLARHNARVAVDVVENIIHLRNTLVTRWTKTPLRRSGRGQTASMMQRIEELGPPSVDDEFLDDDEDSDDDSEDGYELYDGVVEDPFGRKL